MTPIVTVSFDSFEGPKLWVLLAPCSLHQPFPFVSPKLSTGTVWALSGPERGISVTQTLTQLRLVEVSHGVVVRGNWVYK